MLWKIHSFNEYPGNLWQDWDRLNALHCESHPMLDSRFVRSLTEHFPAKIEVLSAHQDGTCTAIILLEKSSSFIKRPYLPSQAQLALAVFPNDIDDFNPFGKARLQLPALRLDLIAIDSKYQKGIAALNTAEVKTRAINIVVDMAGSFEQYWNNRPRNLRKNMSRYINRADKDLNGYELKVVTDKAAMELSVARYGFLESRGWKGKANTALHPGNSQGNFYRDVLEQFASSNHAFIFEIWANNMLMASRLCIGNGDLLIILKTTFDEQFRKHAFGKILLFETLNFIFTNSSARTVDFYTNATKDQLDWSTDSRPMFNISFYKPYFQVLFKQAQRTKRTLRSRRQVNRVQCE